MTTKSITLKGINRAVPQSKAGDGYCQEIINMRFRKGCWRPIPGNVVIGSSLFTYLGNAIEFDTIYLHDVEGGPNWIGGKDNAIYQINTSIGVATLLQSGLSIDIEINVTFLKRFVLITTGSGLLMYLWTGSGYAKLESLPVPDVNLTKTNTFLMDWQTFGQVSFENVASNAVGLLANYYQALNSQSSSEGRLYGSIIYMAAYKLFDGSFILPSVPKYFEVSNDGVIISQNMDGSGGRSGWMKFTMSALRASINNADFPSTLEGTKDLVQSICIFATRCTPLHKIDEVSFTSNFPVNGDKTILYKTFAEYFPLNSDFGKLAESEGFYKIHEFVFDTLVSGIGRTFADVDTKNYYQDFATRQILPTDQFSHHKIMSKIAYTYNDRLHSASIKTIYGDPYIQWNKFKELFDMGSSTVPGKAVVWLKTSLGNVIKVHDITVPYFKPATTIIEIKTTLLLAQSRIDYLNANPSSVANLIPGSVYLRIKTVPAGFTSVLNNITYLYNIVNVKTWDVCYRITNGATQSLIVPSIVGYNDSRAYRMMITFHTDKDYIIFDKPLKKNVGMNFAYWNDDKFSANDLSLTDNFKDFIPAASDLTKYTTVPEPVSSPFDNNRIQVSEIQNPLIFPAANSYQVGTGDIYAIMAGSEPMSTGQYGQFPLQVFTSKGVYAMEVGTGDILYANISPVNGEVANNAKNIISVAGGVLYSTEKGLFVLVGREPTQLSEIVEGMPELSMSVNKTEINTLLSDQKFTPGLAGSLSDIDFLEYLKDSIVGFDQINKELIVSNKAKGYSYIYSFESKLWFKVSFSYKLLINNWPRLTGISGTTIYDLSAELTSGMVETMIITCAQSFELPETSKKIERAILRSKISTTTGTKYAGLYIFASDDVETYQIITGRQRTGEGLKDMIVQRSPGSAKFYVFVANGQMSIDSEIKDIDIDFVPRWNNKLR